MAALLDRVSGTVSPSFFFQNVWLVLVTAPNSRIPALNYLSRRLPKLESDDGPYWSLHAEGRNSKLIEPFGPSHQVSRTLWARTLGS